MSSPYCKLDGLTIMINTGTFSDQMAQEVGFCNAGCKEVYEAIRNSEKGRNAA